MNPPRHALVLLSAALSLLPTKSSRADGPPARAPRTTVLFVHPEAFTDVKETYVATAAGRRRILAQLKDYLVEEAGARVPGNARLQITVTNVDLAGDFEPWRGPWARDVRIVSDLYPPAIDLSFELREADGKVLASGRRELRDPQFLVRARGDRSDPRVYEKALLAGWLRDEFDADEVDTDDE